MELLANPGLRRTLIMSGVTLTGIELFTFYFPVYGRIDRPQRLGDRPGDGELRGRGIHRAPRHAHGGEALGEIGVLTASLFIAGAHLLARAARLAGTRSSRSRRS
jgi:hypothetical protein